MQEEKPEIKKRLSWAGLQRLLSLLKFMWPKRWAFFGGLGALAVSSLGTLAFPMLLGDLLDAANPDASLAKINQIALILLVIFAINAVFSYFRIYLFAIVTQFMLARLRQTTYDQLIRLPMAFFSERRVGELNSRITADIAVLQETFTFTIAQFIRQLIIIIGGISLLTLISYKLTLFMLAFVPLVAVGARIFGKKVRNLSKDAQSQLATSNVIVEETLQGINNVKAFNNENYETTRYFNATNEVIQIALKGAKWRALFISLIVFSLFTSIVGVIWFGVYLVNQGAGISSGDLFKFILYTLFIGASISGMADLYSQVQKAIGATDSLLDILEEPTELELKGDCVEKTQLQGNVSFNKVFFSYPSRPELKVLKGISFDVKTGQKVALVGASGAGKTTITALLFRFYEPDSGSILLDGIPANQINLNCLRRQMAIVPQEVLLFGGTIYENIAYGNTEAAEDEIIEAAQKANALEFIMSFPLGFQTVVGERGVQLSGGQKQRIAIARAILRDPKILVLDEATSALDTASESMVQAALNELMKGRTAIIIAHRLSTIREADRILVIDQGRIVESGSHEELLARDNGKYLALQQLAV
ncbi:MAG: ABC transporter transmembrane domain-containing protein [Bacteroidales bacterium]|jgi:ABC-type multidrug transport system fused ATPase/permease subunit|nr:ABC transporter transmembrane domain-containing protein [Bacteroidales bacterium]MDY0084366.1 ABC transporter transmembrane domain-containing protein [Bacteroidales bacterium]